MSGKLDFDQINRAALAAFPAVLARILPSGKQVHNEWVALNPRRLDRNLGSFKVKCWAFEDPARGPTAHTTERCEQAAKLYKTMSDPGVAGSVITTVAVGPIADRCSGDTAAARHRLGVFRDVGQSILAGAENFDPSSEKQGEMHHRGELERRAACAWGPLTLQAAQGHACSAAFLITL
jgi:hypothetical protein